MGVAVAAPTAQLEVRERVRSTTVEWDAVMDFEVVGGAAGDADTVALPDAIRNPGPLPAAADLPALRPAVACACAGWAAAAFGAGAAVEAPRHSHPSTSTGSG